MALLAFFVSVTRTTSFTSYIPIIPTIIPSTASPAMDPLLHQFSSLSDQATKKTPFNPAGIDDLFRLLDLEARRSLSAMDAQHREAAATAQKELREAEEHLASLLESATAEFHDTRREMDAMSAEQLSRLTAAGDAARRSGEKLSRYATATSERFASKIRPCS